MIWFVWFILALEILVIALGLRIMWLMVWEAVRAPADPSSPSRHQPQHPPRRKVKPSSRREDEDYPALFALEEVDERGYVGSRKDRKSTRLNSSHANISYAVFCLKK